jgi:hypothetical protein
MYTHPALAVAFTETPDELNFVGRFSFSFPFGEGRDGVLRRKIRVRLSIFGSLTIFVEHVERLCRSEVIGVCDVL